MKYLSNAANIRNPWHYFGKTKFKIAPCTSAGPQKLAIKTAINQKLVTKHQQEQTPILSEK